MNTKHFSSTREYHNARHAWLKNLPALRYTEEELAPIRRMYIDDMDRGLLGKRGVFFPFNNCFYVLRKVLNASQGLTVGHVKLLTPHAGIIFLVLDDLQGNAINEVCLTKEMEMEILPNFSFAQEDYSFEVWLDKSILRNPDGTNRMETKTRVDLRDLSNGAIVAVSSALFVQNQVVLTNVHSQLKKDRSKIWTNVAPLCLAGEHATDPNMSFVLRLPRPSFITAQVIPSWWEGQQVQRCAPKRSPFEGRFEIYNVEFTKLGGGGGVRAIVLPLLTCEGAPNIAHGGAAASASMEVLMNLVPDLRVKKYAVHFKRPILLEVKMVIEWEMEQGGEGWWNGVIFDWNHNTLQQMRLQASRGEELRLLLMAQEKSKI